MKQQQDWNIMTSHEMRHKNPAAWRRVRERKRKELERDSKDANGQPIFRNVSDWEAASKIEAISLTIKQDCFQVIFPPGCTGADKALIAAAVMGIRTEYVEPDWRPYCCCIGCSILGVAVGSAIS